MERKMLAWKEDKGKSRPRAKGEGAGKTRATPSKHEDWSDLRDMVVDDEVGDDSD